MGRIFEPSLRMNDLPQTLYWTVMHRDGEIIGEDRSLFFLYENAEGNWEAKVRDARMRFRTHFDTPDKSPITVEILQFKLVPTVDYPALVGNLRKEVITYENSKHMRY